MSKLNKSEVQSTLKKALTTANHEFILEVSKENVKAKKQKQYFLRLKGKNGEKCMHQEGCDRKAGAEYLAARLIKSGLRAKYKDVTGE
ncbi:MAG: hypothetical protein JNM00_06860 [Flavobacteriales bacterium]|nr:hypothetical protein [Flavobacteriales bacterium]